jgi:hypothetical protein
MLSFPAALPRQTQERGGLNADILTDGTIRVGDRVSTE